MDEDGQMNDGDDASFLELTRLADVAASEHEWEHSIVEAIVGDHREGLDRQRLAERRSRGGVLGIAVLAQQGSYGRLNAERKKTWAAVRYTTYETSGPTRIARRIRRQRETSRPTSR